MSLSFLPLPLPLLYWTQLFMFLYTQVRKWTLQNVAPRWFVPGKLWIGIFGSYFYIPDGKVIWCVCIHILNTVLGQAWGRWEGHRTTNNGRTWCAVNVSVCVCVHMCMGTLMSESGPQSRNTWDLLLQGDRFNTQAKLHQYMILRKGVNGQDAIATRSKSARGM